MSGWLPTSVGALPGAQEAQATADSYTYGAASEALSTGQAMAAWADLQAKQNVATISHGKLGPATCPTGFLISLPNAQGLQTCVNQRNLHIALRWRDECDSSKSQSDYASLWFLCSILPRWFELHHPVALAGYSTSVGEAKKMLPTALRQIGLLAPGRWEDVKGEIHALTRRIFFNAPNFDRTEQSVENELVNSIAPVYDAAAQKGGDVPTWIVNPLVRESSSWTHWLLLAGAGLAGLYLVKPSFVRGAWSAGRDLVSKVRT